MKSSYKTCIALGIAHSQTKEVRGLEAIPKLRDDPKGDA